MKIKPIIHKHKVLSVGILAAAILAMILFIGTPYLNSILIDEAILKNNKEKLLISVVIFSLAIIFGDVLLTIRLYLTVYLETLITLEMRNTFHQKIRNLKSILNINEGKFLSLSLNDLALSKQRFRLLLSLFIDYLQLIIIFTIITIINWKYLIIVLPVIPIYAFFPKILGYRINKYSNEVQSKWETISTSLSNSYNVSKEIRIYNKESWDQDKQTEHFKSINRSVLYLEYYKTLYIIGDILYSIFLCLLMYLGGLSVIDNSITIGTLLALITYVGYIADPVYRIVSTYGLLRSYEASDTRISDFLSIEERSHSFELFSEDTSKDIQFVNVNYFRENKIILSEINLSIQEGQFIGIVGKSGSGKTTFLNLLAKLSFPHSGKILIQNKDIQSIKDDSYYQHLKIVFQDSKFFQGTLKDNLFLEENFTDYSLVYRLLENLDLKFLSNDLEYPIEKDGSNLSGGQKQKLSLIRALISNPAILLLDEITSSLDEDSRLNVLNLLKEFRKGKTTIFVTHNINNLEITDSIFMFEDGKVYEKITQNT